MANQEAGGAEGGGATGGAINSQIITIDESRVSHIFRDAEGHIPDTIQNRELLESVANNANNILGTDKYGTVWAAQTQENGSQVWVGIRNGQISYGGVNQVPRVFNSSTGLASPLKPKS